MKNAYPVILEKTADGYLVAVPDFDVFTQGKDIAEAIVMARDLIGLMGVDLLDAGKKLPPPHSVLLDKVGDLFSYGHCIGSVNYVDVDFAEYRRRINNRSVRKNCTIPQWLADRADRMDLNYSRILQDALIRDLNCSAQNLFDSAVMAAQNQDYVMCHTYLDQLTEDLFGDTFDTDPFWAVLTRHYFKTGVSVLFECFSYVDKKLSMDRFWDNLTLDLCYDFFVHVSSQQFMDVRSLFAYDQHDQVEKALAVPELLDLSNWVESCSDKLWDDFAKLDIVHLLQRGIDCDPDNPFRTPESTIFSMFDSDASFDKWVVGTRAIVVTKLSTLIAGPDSATEPLYGFIELETLFFWRLICLFYEINDRGECPVSFGAAVVLTEDCFERNYFERVFLAPYLSNDDD